MIFRVYFIPWYDIIYGTSQDSQAVVVDSQAVRSRSGSDFVFLEVFLCILRSVYLTDPFRELNS